MLYKDVNLNETMRKTKIENSIYPSIILDNLTFSEGSIYVEKEDQKASTFKTHLD